MIERIELLQAPAEWRALHPRALAEDTCVVFDVLRATSSMMVALAHGAERILPCAEIEDALAWRASTPEVLLAGERDGVRIKGAGSAGVDFDLGNSPREFESAIVRGRCIAMTTTNGTRALRACTGAAAVWTASFLNLDAVVARLREQAPRRVLLVAAGTGDDAAMEDSLAAGACCERLWTALGAADIGDAARMARELYRAHATDLAGALALATNGARLLAHADLAGDVAYCARIGVLDLVGAVQSDGSVQRA